MSGLKVPTPQPYEKYVAMVEIQAPSERKEFAKFDRKFRRFKQELDKLVRVRMGGRLVVKGVMRKEYPPQS